MLNTDFDVILWVGHEDETFTDLLFTSVLYKRTLQLVIDPRVCCSSGRIKLENQLMFELFFYLKKT